MTFAICRLRPRTRSSDQAPCSAGPGLRGQRADSNSRTTLAMGLSGLMSQKGNRGPVTASDLSKVSEPGSNRERTQTQPKLLTAPDCGPGWECQSHEGLATFRPLLTEES